MSENKNAQERRDDKYDCVRKPACRKASNQLNIGNEEVLSDDVL